MNTRSLLIFCFLVALSYQEIDYTLRLGTSEGSYYGQLNVWYNGYVLPICDDYFDWPDAQVACYQLGYTGYYTYSTSQYCNGGEYNFHMNHFQCGGNERRMQDCSHSHIDNCGSGECIYIQCHTERALRLGYNNILEYKYSGYWYSVCDDYFGSNMNASNVACRQMGYLRAETVRYGQSCNAGGSFWLDNVQCNGNEQSILQCTTNSFGSEDCSSGECIQLYCTHEPERDSVLEFYLDRDHNQLYGYGALSSYNSYTGELTGTSYNLVYISDTSKRIQMKTVSVDQVEYHIKFFFKMTDRSNSSGSNYYLLYDGYGYEHLYLNFDGDLCIYNHIYGTQCAEGYGFLFTPYWHHVVLSVSSGDVRVYIDGQIVTWSNSQQYHNGTYNRSNIQLWVNYNQNWQGWVEDLNIYATYWHSSNVQSYYNSFNLPACAYIFSECNYQGEAEAICADTSNLTLDYMRSMQIPSGKEITLYTQTGFAGEYQTFTENVECQELVFAAEQASE